ncbi:MAG: carboxypeptidase-like regulatory domain-containing protein [Tannerellaceae bacterium]|nr:carboxypeptidase-like regulatory domain-containing protein [Tannerellaceae bacterium]
MVNLQNDDISLKDAFIHIEQQTGYSIAYEQSGLDLQIKRKISLSDMPLKESLEHILKNTGYTYKIRSYHIIIYPHPNQLKTVETNPGIKRKVTQTIRGIVKDASSGPSLSSVTIAIPEIPGIGTSTNEKGEFIIPGVPVGRYQVIASFVGYHTYYMNEVLVNSSKETFLEFQLQENIFELDEVVVLPEIKKDETLNPMAITGGRMISMEEASRFANGFDDPARLSAAFAGVAGDVASNGVAIRGNAPQFTQWRLEGVEIPAPTHYADLFGLGGGFLSALSTQVTGNSDFYNGAFPAEYTNALSGIFDIHLRNGNNRKHEHTFQFALLGVDFASEGPLGRKQNSSYLLNYRLSSTSLATDGETNLKYQDLAFKLHFPTEKAGTFSVWMLGLTDRNKTKREEEADWETLVDRQTTDIKQEKLSGGITHHYYITPNTYIRSSLSAIYSKDRIVQDQLTLQNQQIIYVADLQNYKWDFVAGSYLHKKFSSRHINRTGITFSNLNYDLDYKVSPYMGLDIPMQLIAQGKGANSVVSAFSSSVININEFLKASLGITGQYLT